MSKFATLKTVAAAAGVCAALFAGGSANAYVYGVSSLDLSQLQILATGQNGGTNTAVVNNYSFKQSNTADLNGNSVTKNGSCGGTSPGPANSTCNAFGPAVLKTDAANAGGSTILRGNNDFSMLGFGTPGASYANSNSVLTTAELVQGIPTSSKQIAEALLNTNGVASAGATQTSFSSLTTTLALSGTFTDLSMNFLASLYLQSAIMDLDGFYDSTANSTVTATLTRKSDGKKMTWSPNGDTTSGCANTMGGSTACDEAADGFNLQAGVSAGFNPQSDVVNESGAFGVTFKKLIAGEYTLTLVSATTTTLSRDVPEPGALALLGIALAGLAFTSKRKANKQA